MLFFFNGRSTADMKYEHWCSGYCYTEQKTAEEVRKDIQKVIKKILTFTHHVAISSCRSPLAPKLIVYLVQSPLDASTDLVHFLGSIPSTVRLDQTNP